jgi:hypothetical protein
MRRTAPRRALTRRRRTGLPALLPRHSGAIRAHHRGHRHQVRGWAALKLAERAWAALNARAPRSVVVASGGGLKAWPELVGAIVQTLDSGNLDAADGALDALFKARRAARADSQHCCSRCLSRRCVRKCRTSWTWTFRGCPRARRRCWCRGCWRCLQGAPLRALSVCAPRSATC